MPDLPAKIHAVPSVMSSPNAGGYWSTHERGDGRSTPFLRGDVALKLVAALQRIREYSPPDEIREGDSYGEWGVDHDEAITMAYENVLQEAANALAAYEEETSNAEPAR